MAKPISSLSGKYSLQKSQTKNKKNTCSIIQFFWYIQRRGLISFFDIKIILNCSTASSTCKYTKHKNQKPSEWRFRFEFRICIYSTYDVDRMLSNYLVHFFFVELSIYHIFICIFIYYSWFSFKCNENKIVWVIHCHKKSYNNFVSRFKCIQFTNQFFLLNLANIIRIFWLFSLFSWFCFQQIDFHTTTKTQISHSLIFFCWADWFACGVRFTPEALMKKKKTISCSYYTNA